MRKICSQCERRGDNCGDCPNLYAEWESTEDCIGAETLACDGDEGLGIALDVGTTTLAFALYNLRNGQRLAVHTRMNSQRAWGADVITRIQHAVNGHAAEMRACIMKDIRAGAEHILAEATAVRRMSIAGNTTMLHLLCGESVEALGTAPFAPVFLKARRVEFLPNCEAVTLAGVSAFVGADIVAGLLCAAGDVCGDEAPRGSPAHSLPSVLLIDLGTNGEMALMHRGEIFAAATAAGPAFEAGNISCGMGGTAGAIYDIRYEKGIFACQTIGGKPPAGICGTGVIALTAELVRHKLVSETGRLHGDLTKGITPAPEITFTQQDLREVQLAKSAIRAGVEILLDAAACAENEITNVYIAGGFAGISAADAAVIGLLPAALAKKARPAGNTSLGGAARALLSRAARERADAIAARAKEINLAAHPKFNELYVEHMGF